MFFYGSVHYITCRENLLCITNSNKKSISHILPDNYVPGTLVDIKLPDNFVYPIEHFRTLGYGSLITDSEQNVYVKGCIGCYIQSNFKDFTRIEIAYPNIERFLSSLPSIDDIALIINRIYVLSSGKLRYIDYGNSNSGASQDLKVREIKDIEVDEIYYQCSFKSSNINSYYIIFRSCKDLYLIFHGLKVPIKIDTTVLSEIVSVKLYNGIFFVLDSLGDLYFSEVSRIIYDGDVYLLSKLNTKRRAVSFHFTQYSIKRLRSETKFYRLLLSGDDGRYYGLEINASNKEIIENEELGYLYNSLVLSISNKIVIFLGEDGCIYKRKVNSRSSWINSSKNRILADVCEQNFTLFCQNKRSAL